MKKIIFSLLFILSASAFGQTFSVFNIDTTNYPFLKADYFAFDSVGKQLANLSAQDFEIFENGLPGKVTNVSCPPVKPIQKISLAMSLDVSGSMGFCDSGELPVELGKTTAIELINNIPSPPSDFALQTCNDKALILQDFTTNKNKILSAIAPIKAGGDNDFTEHLLNELTGLLNIAKTGKNKRIAVLYTDAWWYALTNLELQQCKDTCAKYNIQFFAIIYSRSEAQPDGIKKSLKELAEATGGVLYDGITSTNVAQDIANRLRQTIQGGESCKIEWQSEAPCQNGNTNVSIKLLPLNIIQTEQYYTTVEHTARIEILPKNLIFYNSAPGIKRDTIVKVTAKNNDINITNIKSSNPAFSFDKTSIFIPKDQSVDLKISYTPLDSGYRYIYSIFNFEANYCTAIYYASAILNGKRPKSKSIKLTYPNGGEELLVGSDCEITWNGITPNDSVRLELSIDSGKKWNSLTNEGFGLKYNWAPIPAPTSTNCLIRLTQYQKDTIPQIAWEKCIGGTKGDMGRSIAPTNDGGYIVACETTSSDGDVEPNRGKQDIVILKMNSSGTTEWKKSYGGDGDDYIFSIIQTSDGGFVFIGGTDSQNGDVIGNHSTMPDAWIVKLSSTGSIEWQKCIGGAKNDKGSSIIQTRDGGYIFAGFTESTDGDLIGKKSSVADAWIVKLTSTGTIEWQKYYGGTSVSYANEIHQTDDGGYIVAANTESKDGDVIGKHSQWTDAWILKLSSTGIIEWQKCLGESYDDYVMDLQITNDKGYIFAGVTTPLAQGFMGHGDAWIVKLTSTGAIQWQKSFGGSSNDVAYSIVQTPDSGYVFTGSTDSNDGDINPVNKLGLGDVWVVKLNSAGVLQWQKHLGGAAEEQARSIKGTSDNGFIITGFTGSSDWDVENNHGGSDAWIIKLSADGGIIQQDESDAVFSIVEPKAKAIGVDMGKCLVSMSKDSVITQFTQNIGSYKCRIDSIYIQGADASAFKLIGGFPKYEIDKASSHFAEFNFKPTRIGIHNAEIVVVTQSGTLKVPITGEGVAMQLQIMCGVLDFGKVEVGNQKVFTDTVVVKNISIAPISISKIVKMSPDLEQFDILSGGDPVVLNAGETHKMTLRFKPKFGGRTSGRIGFEYNGTGSPLTATLFGTGIGGVVVSSSDSAYSGEKRNININLKNIKPAGLQAMAKSFSANLKFQGRILAPQDFAQVLSFKNDSITMRVSGDLPNDSTILSIPMIAGLGNVEETTIEISDFKLYDNSGAVIDYDMEVEYGTFKLLGICREGGTRLINPNSQAQILSVRPNPATNAINIEYQLTEKGGAEFLLINDLGETVKQISYAEISDYTQRLETIKLDDLANGRYTLILKTPTISERRSVLVVK